MNLGKSEESVTRGDDGSRRSSLMRRLAGTRGIYNVTCNKLDSD